MSIGPTRIVLFIAAGVFALVACDLTLRIFPPDHLYHCAHERFIRHMPQRPYLLRFDANVDYEGPAFGDLASMTYDQTWREPRREIFITDAAGFRNGPEMTLVLPDVIVIGDSMSAGAGTTQAKTWPALLATRYGEKIYNLSTQGGPWRHFVNLQIERTRLDPRPGAIVLLSLFSGNDLDDRYRDITDAQFLPVNRGLDAWRVSCRTFLRRSPIRLLFANVRGAWKHRTHRTHADVFTQTLPDGRDVAFSTPYASRMRRTPADVQAHANYPALQNTLTGMAHFCRSHALDLRVVLLPSKEEIYGELDAPPTNAFAMAVAEICRGQAVPFTDLRPALAARAEEAYAKDQSLLWWRDDSHLNEAGHAAAADLVDGFCGRGTAGRASP